MTKRSEKQSITWLFSTADTTDSDGNKVVLTDDEKALLLQMHRKYDAAGGKSMEDAVKDVDDTKTVSKTAYDESYTLMKRSAQRDKLKDGRSGR